MFPAPLADAHDTQIISTWRPKKLPAPAVIAIPVPSDR